MRLPVNYSNLSWEERKNTRLAYIKLQKQKCCHCKSSLLKDPPKSILDLTVNKKLFPKNFFRYTIHLHHDHITGNTIGAVHSYCNAVLWQYYNE